MHRDEDIAAGEQRESRARGPRIVRSIIDEAGRGTTCDALAARYVKESIPAPAATLYEWELAQSLGELEAERERRALEEEER